MGHKVKQSLMSSRIDFFYYAFRNVLLVSIPLLIFSIFVFTIPHSSAEISSGADNIQLVLSTSCTVNAVVTSEHTVSLNGGQLDNNVGNTKLSAYCNDNNGYSIYAVGSSNNIDGNTDLIYNNGLSDSYNIRTGVYNDTIQTNPSSWAMKLTAGTGTGIDPVTGESVPTTPPTIINGFDNYSTIPNIYTQVAKRTSGTSMTTDTSVSGSYLDTTYQIYANSAQPAGTYNGKVKYVIVHPNSNHNTIPDLDTAFAAAGKDKIYRDQSGSGPYYAMQDMDSIICNSVIGTGENTAAQLVDLRDNKLYHVAKLADGHCWMTQNLDLEIDATRTYTHNDTDLGWDPNSFDSNATWKPDTTNGRYNLPVNGTYVTGWSNQNNYPYSADPGDVYYYTSNSEANDIKYNSLSECIAANHTEGDCKHYHAGNYYNWTAAIASNNSSGINTDKARANNSICPSGWRLPNTDTVDSNYNEFGRLLYGYNITNNKANGTNSVGFKTGGLNAIRISPLYFTRSGFINDRQLAIPGSAGYYWSNTINSSTNAYDLGFGSNIYPARSDFRNLGWSIRCLAR